MVAVLVVIFNTINITNKIETVDTTSFSINSYWNDQLTTELKFGTKEQITDRCASMGWCGRDGNVFKTSGNAMSAEMMMFGNG